MDDDYDGIRFFEGLLWAITIELAIALTIILTLEVI